MEFDHFVLTDMINHFMENTELPENYAKVAKIEAIHRYIAHKFSTFYTPEVTVPIDVSLFFGKDVQVENSIYPVNVLDLD